MSAAVLTLLQDPARWEAVRPFLFSPCKIGSGPGWFGMAKLIECCFHCSLPH